MQRRLPFEVFDLTQNLSSKVASWDGSCGFAHKTLVEYEECTGETKFHIQGIDMQAGIGTHMDAPSHCIKGGKNINEIEITNLISPCCMIDVSKEVKNANYKINQSNIIENEEKYGKIREGDFVIFHTGWSERWENKEEYRNNLKFPTLSKDAALLLLTRKISGIGIDTLSPDIPSSNDTNNDNHNINNQNSDNNDNNNNKNNNNTNNTNINNHNNDNNGNNDNNNDGEDDEFIVHRLILGAGGYIVENIANANKLPPRGAYSFALPIKTVGGTEAPIRLVAILFANLSM